MTSGVLEYECFYRKSRSKSFVLARKTSTTLLLSSHSRRVLLRNLLTSPTGTELVKCIVLGAKVPAAVALTSKKAGWKDDRVLREPSCTIYTLLQSTPQPSDCIATQQRGLALRSANSLCTPSPFSVSRRAISIYR